MRLGDEGELKKEINHLIGRLLKAKNKLIDENTLTDTLKKDVESIRSRSVNKNVLGIRN